MSASSPRRLEDEADRLSDVLADVTTLYTDLDGTLLGPGGGLFNTSDGERTLAAAAALVDVLDAGIEVVPVSGRNKYQLFDDCRILGLRHYIAEVGALVVHDLLETETENLAGFPRGEPDEGTVVDRIKAAGVLEALFAAFPGKLEHHFPWSRHREYSLILRGEVDVSRAEAAIRKTTDLPLDFVDNGIIRPRQHGLAGCERIHAYHVLPSGVTKASGVAVDASLRGVTRPQAAAVGDSAADVEIAEHVAAFFLVGNAIEDPAAVAAASHFDNVYAASAPMGLGWAEATRCLLADRGPSGG